MSVGLIVRGKTKYGKTRAEQESNLRKDGRSSMSDENFDKLRFCEKKLGIKQGFIGQAGIERSVK
jgi:hypothetical protein